MRPMKGGPMRLAAFGAVEEIPTRSHLCQLYATVDQQAEVVAGLFAGAPSPQREQCLYVGPSPTIALIKAQLRAAGVDVDDAEQHGQVAFTDERAAYLSDGRFDPFFLLSTHLKLITQARQAGYAGVRAAWALTWLVEQRGTPAQLLKYEAMCASVFTFPRQPIVCIAQYQRAQIKGDLAVQLLKLHPLVYVGEMLQRHPSWPGSAA